MGFPKQGYWSRLPFPPPGDLPHPEIEPTSPTLQTDSLPLSHLENLSNVLNGVKFSGAVPFMRFRVFLLTETLFRSLLGLMYQIVFGQRKPQKIPSLPVNEHN